MRQGYRKLDLVEVLNTTANQKEWFDRQSDMVNDVRESARLFAQECKVCFYSMKAGGSVLTERPCGICQTPIHSGNSCIDRLCKKCAEAHRLCKHCGGDMEFNQRRKL